MIPPFETVWPFLNILAVAVVSWLLPLNIIPVLIWLERKGSAIIQDRIGPNRADVFGLRFFGMLHNIADVIKLLMKEDFVPSRTSRFFYLLAPFWFMAVALVPLMTVPLAAPQFFGTLPVRFQAADLDAGVLFILAVTGMGVYGLILAGWASNNKFSLLGALRTTAQMVSYELALAAAVVGVLATYGTARISTLVESQAGPLVLFGREWPLPGWGVFLQPVAFLVVLTCAFAETNRNPFDLPEGESELVAGYHTEYPGMKFALFFMAEYANMVVASVTVSTLFLGGYQVPFVTTETMLAHPREVLMVMLGGLVAAGLAGGAWLFALGVARERFERGMRRLELFLLALGGVLTAVAALAVLPLVPSMPVPPWLPPLLCAIVQGTALMAKVMFFCWLYVWVRWTLPRFRYDQLMRFGWRFLLPLALANLLVTAWMRLQR
jgi:NADH-quinone oxidoreductase subunit H